MAGAPVAAAAVPLKSYLRCGLDNHVKSNESLHKGKH